MSPHLHLATDEPAWKVQLQQAVKSVPELLSLLQLEDLPATTLADHSAFPLLVPRSFIHRMQPGDPQDPLLRQVLPVSEEQRITPGYSTDPVGETGSANARPGVIRKYHGRVLLVLAGGCAVNCRYCFRRHFPYSENQNSRAEWLRAVDEIAADNSVSEVILSGGEPLLVPDGQLQELVARIAAIPHVRRLRVHTRLPVVIPARVTDGLLAALSAPQLGTVVVIHCNHANELDAELARAVGRLRGGGIQVLNQSVLLAGVNDSATALAELSERLFDAGVLPYYLHLLDKVQGAAHFDVDETRARHLLAEITARLPGYLVPRLVREEAGELSKTGIPPWF